MTPPKHFSAATPPKHLSAASKKLWRELDAQYLFEPHHYRLLQEALQSLDRADQARRVIEAAGLMVESRFGELKVNPAAAVERDSRAAFARLMKQLGLDLEGPPPPSAGR